MDFLKRFMGPSSPPTNATPDPYADDDVYPVHILDDTKTFRNIIIAWTLCFNDVLDADKLQSSLAKLLENGDWRKLGGRLRLNENGKLEIHVPRHFTPSRPAFSYSHSTTNISIQEHELGQKLPKASGTGAAVLTFPGPTAFNSLATRLSAPATFSDLIAGDTPQISVHITSFTDATLVGLSWPHTLMDVMGNANLLRAWSLVLAGRESEVQPVLGAKEDALCVLTDDATKPVEEYVLRGKQLKGLNMARFGARFAWDMLTGDAPETRTVYLPRSVVEKLRREAEKDLPAQGDGDEKAFISDGDVLTAWTLRCIASSLPSPRPITALHAMNARFRLPELINTKGVYVQNMLVPGFTFLSPHMATGSLGPIALHNRQRLLEQATESQVLASLREQRVSGDPSTLLYSDADALLVPFTDWTKARFFDAVDFGGAVVDKGDGGEGRRNPPGTMVFHHCTSRRVNAANRLLVHVLGRDWEGGYWLTLIMGPRAWERVEESLRELD